MNVNNKPSRKVRDFDRTLAKLVTPKGIRIFEYQDLRLFNVFDQESKHISKDRYIFWFVSFGDYKQIIKYPVEINISDFDNESFKTKALASLSEFKSKLEEAKKRRWQPGMI